MQTTVKELCSWLEMPPEASAKLETAAAEIDFEALQEEIVGLTDQRNYESARLSLKEKLGEDEDGWKVLACMMRSMCRSWELYQEHHIAKEIFLDTMKCFPRFIREHKASYDRYGFDRDFWPGRQLSLLLFRLGTLEFELVRHGEDEADKKADSGSAAGENRCENGCEISIHIPSDAVLLEEKIHASYRQAEEFFAEHYPEASGCEYTCESWMMSPALKELLPKESRILFFQSEFRVRSWDRDSDEFLEWVFKRKDLPLEKLPEDTSLQRRMKEYLRNGGRVGEATAVLELSRNCGGDRKKSQ